MDDERLAQEVQRLAVEVARLTSDVKAAFKRIDEQKQLSESVHALAISVERQTMALDRANDNIRALQSDVDELKARPAKRWDGIVTAAITALVTAIITFLLTRNGLK